MENNVDLERLQQKVAGVDEKVTEILHLLGGSDLDRDIGLVNRVKEQEKAIAELEKRVAKLEKWKDRVLWMLVGMGFPAGVGAWELIKNFFKH